MTKAVGVEINESRVKLVSVENTSTKTRILQYHEEVIAVDPAKTWDESAAAALNQAFAKSKISRNRVVASIDSGDAVLRDVSLPFKLDEQIRKTVKSELESLVHNYSIEDLIVDYFKTGETDKGVVLLAAAVPKEVIRKRLKLLEGVGVDPIALDLDVAALYNTLLNGGAVDSDEPFLVVYGTPKFTKILFVESKRPKSIRTIRFSIPSPEAINKEREERRKASQWETKEVEGPVPYLVLPTTDATKFSELDFETKGSLIEILAKEISRFLLANAASAAPSQIMLTGEFENEEAAQLLEAATRIPVKTYNLLEVIDHPFTRPLPEQSAKLGVPLGLALKGCEVDALGMDFRKDEFSYRKKFDAVKTTALVTVELILMFLAAVAFHLYYKKKDFAKAQRAVYDEQKYLFSTVAPPAEVPDEPSSAYPSMKEYRNKLERMYGVQHPIENSALQIWRMLYDALKRVQDKHGAQTPGGDALWVMIDSVDVRQTTTSGQEGMELTVRARAKNVDQANIVRNEMRLEPLFAEARFDGTIRPVPEGVEFTIKVERKKK